MKSAMARVRAAASVLSLERSIFSGGVMRISPSSAHSILTPMLSITSMSRFTSSMRGIFFNIVVPRLSNDAAKSATAAFFEIFVCTVPESTLLPITL